MTDRRRDDHPGPDGVAWLRALPEFEDGLEKLLAAFEVLDQHGVEPVADERDVVRFRARVDGGDAVGALEEAEPLTRRITSKRDLWTMREMLKEAMTRFRGRDHAH